MGIRMSIARCCCGVLCSTATCYHDEFDTYGSGNSVLSNSFYDSAIGTGALSTSAKQTASEYCRLDSGTSSSASLMAKWGVGGDWDSPAFDTAYADRTSISYTIKDVRDLTQTTSIGYYPEGQISGVDFPFLKFQLGYVNTNTYRKRASYTDVDNNTQNVDIVLNSSVTKSYYQHTYAVEIYDYQQQIGSDSKSRSTFEWKIIEDGSVLLESHDGTSRNYSRFGAAMPDEEAYDWCSRPRARIAIAGFAGFGTSNFVDFDDLKLSVNGDTACHV